MHLNCLNLPTLLSIFICFCLINGVNQRKKKQICVKMTEPRTTSVTKQRCFLFFKMAIISKRKLNCQFEKQIYRDDDVCIDFGVQMWRYLKKERICLFDFADGLNEREIFVRKRRVRLIWNKSRYTEEKLRILAYHFFYGVAWAEF